jgi:sugar phosphate isomerase/epimerase
MNSSRIVLANLTNPHANNNNGMLARLKQKLESRSVTNPISNLTAPIESAKPKKPEQHPKLSADPCVRLHSATNRTLAVQSAAIAIADGQSVLPEFIPSVDRDRLVKDMHKLQETLKYVNYTVYYKVPRPS